MNIKELQFIFEDNADNQKSLELLKKVLVENGYKPTSTGANIMLTEVEDELGVEVANHYKALAMVYLPPFL